MCLLNLQNVPGNEICGMRDDLLQWVTSKSDERYLHELSDSFLQMLNDDESSEIISPQITKELDLLEREFTPKSSLKQQESTIKRFKVFLESKQLSSDILNIPIKVLNDYLRYFYSQLRNREGCNINVYGK